jgi:uncharacterized protein YhdP
MARLQRLALPESESQRVEQYLDQAQGALPMLDVQVEDFELRGRKLGPPDPARRRRRCRPRLEPCSSSASSIRRPA